jgi:predicted DNA-binding transcriptional regulator YafY
MAVAHAHIPRLLHLVRLLERRTEIPVAEVARELGVRERDVEEDVRLLSTCGVPPYSPADLYEIEIEGGRVRLGRRMLDLPRFQLTAEEVAGLRLAARIAAAEGWGESRPLRRAIGKLEAALLPAERERGRRLARRIGVPGGAPAQARHLAALERAVRECREVELTYFTEWSEVVSKRTVRPYAVAATPTPEGRYLIGHDSKRDAVITFRADHILRLRLTARRFERPRDFDPMPYVSGIGPGNQERTDVVLRFAAAAVPLARDQFPAARAAPGGGLTVRLKVWAGASFCRFVLSWAGACEVLEPLAVREGVREYARQVAAEHEA